jgi:cytidylate kinase
VKKELQRIAIDGPVGAGKSTIAKECARRLGIVYMDTGALYRAVGVFCAESGIDAHDEAAVADFLGNIKLEIKLENNIQYIIINGDNITGRIRTPEASMLASKVSSYGAVRGFLLDLQREIAAQKSVIMDGRDIGTVILPDADIKIFLSADARERARRRYDELINKGTQVSFDDVLADLEKRDAADSSRVNAPLKQAADAILVDTTGNTFEQSVGRIMEIINNRGN